MNNARKNYNDIKKQFSHFVMVFQNKQIQALPLYVKEDVHAYLSIVPSFLGENHTLYNMQKLILDMPKTKEIHFQICNYICRLKNNKEAYQCAEVVFQCQNNQVDDFIFVVTFCNIWTYLDDNWKLSLIRADFDDIGGSLTDVFKQNWYFENKVAHLTASTHLPCILPDLDNPYFQVPECEQCLTESELIEECFYKFHYGIDWMIFKFCKETLADQFVNEDKRAFIARIKFKRQSYRYYSSPYYFEDITIHGHHAEARVGSLLSQCRIREVKFDKHQNHWEIVAWKEEEVCQEKIMMKSS